ncbi:uncharacterized protein FFNC_15534 [Fusarium fujikuroi]|nr:uncharacterized protein FFNC_15534 [Fusarium fujikuroi]
MHCIEGGIIVTLASIIALSFGLMD